MIALFYCKSPFACPFWYASWRIIHVNGDISTQPMSGQWFINKQQTRSWQWSLTVEIGGTDNLHSFHFDALH
jgi:hypothetical protein